MQMQVWWYYIHCIQVLYLHGLDSTANSVIPIKAFYCVILLFMMHMCLSSSVAQFCFLCWNLRNFQSTSIAAVQPTEVIIFNQITSSYPGIETTSMGTKQFMCITNRKTTISFLVQSLWVEPEGRNERFNLNPTLPPHKVAWGLGESRFL